jgi:hypothetical protein
MVFLFAAQVSTSLPTRYRRFGLLLVTASRIAFETTSTEKAFFAISFEFACILCIISEYGELGSCAFLAKLERKLSLACVGQYTSNYLETQ